ncbi:shikimate dehydrogenase [Selenomonas sp. TAMA-11512]|uniref:shikimate dehydrogenase n=1 Tax=Selenomonas sp. TAMA-11512 TaxID=3095337 RepID=UPI00308EE960|nr:shikimate dehydrogenase [Selenomonas sp. TAMA-11512]
MVSGKTINLAVIGDPIAHSMSPQMHNAAIEAAGIDYIYTACHVKEGHLQEAVDGFAALGFRGFNVTIPYKQTILPLLDALDDAAKMIGAVNTVVIKDGRKKGYNTDAAGFLSPLKAQGMSVKGKRAVVFGAGGAARAVLYGLISAGAQCLTVGARNEEKAKALASSFQEMREIAAHEWHKESFAAAIREADLIVNTTPLGMHPGEDETVPIVWDDVRREAIIYDIIYTPAVTRFLREAKEHGCKTINGEAMLVGQGAEAFHLWTGTEPNRQVMTDALRKALQSKQSAMH